MKDINVFIVRAVLGAAFAFLLTRFFHPGVSLAMVAGLAIVLVGLAYLFDYLRQRKSDS